MSSILKVDTIEDQNGNLIISKNSGGGGFLNPYASSSAPITYTVTVASKTSAHPYFGVGSSNGYLINGIEAPIIEIKGNDTSKPYHYKFDQSDASNSGHPLLFYNNASKTTQFTTGVTTNGSPGSSGAYTMIAVDSDTPNILYYQCSAHGQMGNHSFATSPTINTGVFLKMPPADGTTGQFMKTDGSGTLSFGTITLPVSPTVANVSQTISPASATTISITGTGFVSIPQVQFVNGSTGAITNSNTVAFTNATTLSVNCTLASGNYFVRVENPDGNAGRSANNIITASTAPSFTTAAGSLGTVAGNFSGTVFTVVGSSDSAIAFSEVTSVLVGNGGSQANCSLATNGVISTSDFGGSSTTPTTYNFTLRITDAEGQTVDRAFSLTSSFGATGGGQFN